MLDTGVSIFFIPQSQNTSLCSSSIDIKHESSGTNITTTHTQVQPVIDVPAKTNASTSQVVSPLAEGGSGQDHTHTGSTAYGKHSE